MSGLVALQKIHFLGLLTLGFIVFVRKIAGQSDRARPLTGAMMCDGVTCRVEKFFRRPSHREPAEYSFTCEIHPETLYLSLSRYRESRARSSACKRCCFDLNDRTRPETRERTLSVLTLSMKGHFHSPNLDHEFFPGYVCQMTGREGDHCAKGDAVNLFFSNFLDGMFAIDRLMFVRILMTIVLALFFIFAMRKPQIVPKGLQNVGEICIDFVRIYIAEEILGKKEARRFMPIIATIFFLVVVGNLPSVVPGLNVSPNARVGMPLTLALLSYVVFVYAGVKKHGFFRFMKCSLMAPGLPILIYPLVIVIEFFSTFVLRPLTLTIRLMANMLAGHLILVLLFAATNFFVWQLNGWTLVGGFTLVFGIFFTLFELLVIFLQAYIFALLSAVYIELSLHADEH